MNNLSRYGGEGGALVVSKTVSAQSYSAESPPRGNLIEAYNFGVTAKRRIKGLAEILEKKKKGGWITRDGDIKMLNAQEEMRSVLRTSKEREGGFLYMRKKGMNFALESEEVKKRKSYHTRKRRHNRYEE